MRFFKEWLPDLSEAEHQLNQIGVYTYLSADIHPPTTNNVTVFPAY